MFAKGCASIFKNIISNSHVFDNQRYLHQTHYEILGLTKNCTTKDIREAYIKLSKRYHPDINTTNNSQNNFVKVLEAYSVLSKPSARRHYDWELTHVRPFNDLQRPPPRPRAQGYSTAYAYDDPSFGRYRTQSRNWYDQNDSYYGVRGIRRVSNGLIALICVFVTAVGVTLQFFAIRHSVSVRKEVMQQKAIENEQLYAKLQEEAAKNGNELQIELLEKRFRKNQYYRQQQQEQQQPKDYK